MEQINRISVDATVRLKKTMLMKEEEIDSEVEEILNPGGDGKKGKKK